MSMMLLLISDGVFIRLVFITGLLRPHPNPPLIATYGIDLQPLEGEYNGIRTTVGSLQCHDDAFQDIVCGRKDDEEKVEDGAEVQKL